MPMNPTAAASAYTSAARLLGGGAQESAGPSALAETSGFGSLVQSAMDGTAAAGKATDAKVAELAAGKADVVDLVTAVAETELAVETLVSVRDRVISAYQNIMNMPI